ncbi:MAG TPA: hypothetical protein VGL48_10545 [Acidimicrobiales bacterium]
MPAKLAHEDRAAFKRCRRAWDFGSHGRRNLEPAVAVDPLDTDRAIRDALAVYYYPGMWDWSRGIVLPLVDQALQRAVAAHSARRGEPAPSDAAGRYGRAKRLLHAYFDWAPEVERIAPVLVEADFDVDLADPDQPGSGLFTPSGENVRYRGRVDLLSVDQHDAYWIVRHRVVREWTPLDELVRDEEAVAACWAWEQFYLGMEIAGTIHNEMRLPLRSDAEPERPSAAPERGGVAQHEGSGGGRSVPQHRRLYAMANEPLVPERVIHDTGPLFRRTWIRRTRAEVLGAGRQLASEARAMFATDIEVYPSPSRAACRRCPFSAPCVALYEGRADEADAVLASSYRPRPDVELVEGRLGGVTWSMGRGAAPPRFSGTDR